MVKSAKNKTITTDLLTFQEVKQIVNQTQKLVLSPHAQSKIEQCRQYLDHKLATSDALFYGINTGFGFLQNVRIDKTQIQELQYNLLQSHACGVGERVPKEIVRLMLLLKIQSLAYGHSGVQTATVQRLIDFYNADILPIVFNQGSLGASGDLSPLAHLALPLIGMGDVYFKNKEMPASEALKTIGWQPIELQSKEGLALINGTQFMSAYGIHCLLKAQKLLHLADIISAISCDAFDCSTQPFLEQIHKIRAHKGQLKTAETMRYFTVFQQITHYFSRFQLPFVRSDFMNLFPKRLGRTVESIARNGGNDVRQLQ